MGKYANHHKNQQDTPTPIFVRIDGEVFRVSNLPRNKNKPKVNLVKKKGKKGRNKK